MQLFKQTIFLSIISLFSSASFSQTLATDAQLYNWNGVYAGINAGIVKHTMNITDIQATTFYATIQESSNPDFTGGLQLGYRHNLNLSNPISGVYGLEFSTNFASASFKQEYGSPYALYQLNATNELKNLYLLQLIGGIAADKALLFLDAGLSWSTITGEMTALNGIPYFNSFDVNKQAFGTAIGGGVEYAWTHAISTRLKLDAITPNVYMAINNLNNNFQISNNIVQGVAGVNYKFG